MFLEIAVLLLLLLSGYLCFSALRRKDNHLNKLDSLIAQVEQLKKEHVETKQSLIHVLHQQEKSLLQLTSDGQQKNITLILDTLKLEMNDVREQINHSFKLHADGLNTHIAKLNQDVTAHLKSISNEVNQQLDKGFEKTTLTFTNVIKRLTIIDEAQKKINELSSHVLDLQSVFQDKRARGAFGEVQLENLIKDLIPSQNYAIQHTLSNQKRADCILFLPDPTGNVVIDAKFPLENFQLMQNTVLPSEKKKYQTLFKQDIKKHIQDIAEKYIIKGETAEGAIMFIPAEAIFAEIHSNHPDLVIQSHQQHVWLASPSTLMAILTTASAVLKDDATKKQVHIVQEHLNLLAKDFARFEKRMQNLSRHINQANQDVGEIHSSTKKITSRFSKIEQLDLELKEIHEQDLLLDEPEEELN